MQECSNEQLFIMRVWEENNNWKVSLKNIKSQHVQFFASLQSLAEKLNDVDTTKVFLGSPVDEIVH